MIASSTSSSLAGEALFKIQHIFTSGWQFFCTNTFLRVSRLDWEVFSSRLWHHALPHFRKWKAVGTEMHVTACHFHADAERIWVSSWHPAGEVMPGSLPLIFLALEQNIPAWKLFCGCCLKFKWVEKHFVQDRVQKNNNNYNPVPLFAWFWLSGRENAPPHSSS